MGGAVFFMENRRLLAAKQFVIKQVQKSPLVQAVQQKSLKPYKKALSTALEPGNLMPMGRANSKAVARSIAEFENDAAQYKAMQHLRQAEMTANRIKQYTQQKAQEGFNRAHSGQQDAAKLLASYILRKQ